MISRATKKGYTVLLLSIAALGVNGCRHTDSEPPAPQAPQAAEQVSAPAPLTGFERDLQFIRQGHFSHVYVFSRKDGRVIDKNDGDYLRQNAPKLVDVVLTEEGKKAIGGTNFDLEPGNIEALRKHFIMEDYTGK